MPINLSGAYAAGGVKDALLEIVKQRMLEQELAQREEENQFQRLRANRQDTAQEARDKAAETQRGVENARLDAAAKLTTGREQLAQMQDRPARELMDPETQGFGPKATPAVGLPPLPGTNVGGVSPPEVRQGQLRTVDIGGVPVKPRTMEERDAAAALDEQRKQANALALARAKPVSRTELTAYVGPHGEPVQQDQEGRAYIGTQEVPLSSLHLKPPQTSSTLSPGDALSATLRLRSDFRRETTAAQTAVKQYQLMEDALKSVKEGRSAAGSQGVLVTFQKILDPNSVVRESEYARSAAGQSALNQLQGSWDRIVKGGAGVPVAELENFVKTAKGFANKQAEYAATTKDQIDHIAKKYGLEPADITRDLVTELGGGVDGGGGGTTALPPLNQRVVGKTEAVINGKPMVWGAGGWVPK